MILSGSSVQCRLQEDFGGAGDRARTGLKQSLAWDKLFEKILFRTTMLVLRRVYIGWSDNSRAKEVEMAQPHV